ADRVRAAPGVVDRGASLPAGLAACGGGRLPLCGSRRAGADVLARRCRGRDRGGGAVDCDRSAPARECGCVCDWARAEARRVALGFLTPGADEGRTAALAAGARRPLVRARARPPRG